jgi:hypothetical protein
MLSKHYFPELAEDWYLFGIPTPVDLFEEYSKEAVRFGADSRRGEQARMNLKYLSSERALKGAKKGRGRPPEYLNKEVAKKVFRMSQALFLQMREVNDLLTNAEPVNEARIRMILGLYPWVRELGGLSNPLRFFLGPETNQCSPGCSGSCTEC